MQFFNFFLYQFLCFIEVLSNNFTFNQHFAIINYWFNTIFFNWFFKVFDSNLSILWEISLTFNKWNSNIILLFWIPLALSTRFLHSSSSLQYSLYEKSDKLFRIWFNWSSFSFFFFYWICCINQSKKHFLFHQMYFCILLYNWHT